MNDYNIKQLYEEMELNLISSMKRNLKRHLDEEKKIGFKYTQWQAEKLKELKRYQRENHNMINGFVTGLDKDISNHLQRELKQGAISSIKEFNKLNPNAKLKSSKLLNKSFFQTNDRKVTSLINVVKKDIKQANHAVLRMINDQYRQVIHKATFFMSNGTMSLAQAIDMANKDFLSRGLSCIEYKDGRRVNIASYSEMAIRTASLRSQLMGEGDFRKSIGRTLVKVTTHGGACKLCSKWQGKILVDDVYSGGVADGKHTLLSKAMEEGFLHPNCKHGLTTYYPELENIDYNTLESEDNEERQEELNYLDRNIKKYERLAKGSLFPENVVKYQHKQKEYINKKEMIFMTDNGKYEDITAEWLNYKTDYIGKIEVQDFLEDGDIKYKVDNVNVLQDHTKNEKNIAKWFAELRGADVKLLPRVINPPKVKSADFMINSVCWEIKEPEGNSKNTIINQFKHQKAKASNFVIDMHNSDMSMETADKYINQIYNSQHTLWVDTVVLSKNNNIYKVYKRKK